MSYRNQSDTERRVRRKPDSRKSSQEAAGKKGCPASPGAGAEEKVTRCHGGTWGLPRVNDGARLGRGKQPESKMTYRKGGDSEVPSAEEIVGFGGR